MQFSMWQYSFLRPSRPPPELFKTQIDAPMEGSH